MNLVFDLVGFVNILIGGIVGGAIGGIVGWKISDHYAMRSSDELQTVFRVFAEIAEERGFAEFGRDQDGRITSARMIRKGVSDTYMPKLR